MGSRNGPRSMTFTGCWTCKRRKVKCDERPNLCGNCERLGIQCDGYGIRLRWMDDPLAVPDKEKSVTSAGRIRIRRDSGPIYSVDAIDNFLQAIDIDASRGMESRKGPFGLLAVPRSRPVEPEPAPKPGLSASGIEVDGNAQFELLQPDGPPELLPEDILLPEDSRPPAGSTAYTGNALPDSTSATPVTSTENLLLDPSLLDTGELGMEETENFFPVPDAENTGFAGDPGLDLASVADEEIDPSSTTRLDETYDMQRAPEATITIHIPPSISTSLSGDRMADKLMHHYVINIANLLQAVRHRSNPYRDVYAPAALQAASRYGETQLSTTGNGNGTISSVILHSLLACAAFHLWNCSPDQSLYHIVGARHRQQALSLLRTALDSPMADIEYRFLMVAMLSLVTVDVMSGCEADFIVHLQGTKQLQSRRRHWRRIGKATRQLNEISDFLCMLARTMMFPPSATPWAVYDNPNIDEREKAIYAPYEGQSCFAYMYGATPKLAAYIEETCRLAEELDRYQADRDIPDTLLEACERLGDHMLAWTFDGENPGTMAVEDDYMMTIFRYHATAWHQAALIYYYHRIQKCEASYYAAEIRRTAECMNGAEDMKCSPGVETHTAPITWPALVASCDGLERELWTRWWERVQRYRIANIQRQWEFVQSVWHKKDDMEARGDMSFDWMEVFKNSRLSLLPV